MGTKVKVSSKNQIALPAEVRKELGIKCGDTLYVGVVGKHLMLFKEPEDWVEYLRGLGKEVWEGIDAQEYVNAERDSWDR